MDAQQTKTVALKIVVALGLGALSYVVDPTTANAAQVFADNGRTTGDESTETGGGSGSGSGSSVWTLPNL